MFEQTLLAATAKTRRAWTVPMCFVSELAAVGFVALMPLIFFEGLPQGRLAPHPLEVPQGYHPQVPPHVQLVGSGQERTQSVMVEPAQTPVGVHLGPDRPAAAPPDLSTECTGFCAVDSVGPAGPPLTTHNMPKAPDEWSAEPVVRLVAKPTPAPAPIRVSLGVQEAKLINRVNPVYPKLAIQVRASGVVHLAAIIGADGRIRELQVLSGHPLLTPAAVDAVRQWVYRPTMLNGAPVEVMTEIIVTFSLSQR